MISILWGFATVVTLLSATCCVFLSWLTLRMSKDTLRNQTKHVRIGALIGYGVVVASVVGILWGIGTAIFG
ncbi:MAG: hypothetical protein WC565_08085 [Parcubacteria group bacterium]